MGWGERGSRRGGEGMVEERRMEKGGRRIKEGRKRGGGNKIKNLGGI